MTLDTTLFHDYPRPKLANLVILLTVGLAAAFFSHPRPMSAVPAPDLLMDVPVRVVVSPQVGLQPLLVHVVVHQDIVAVAGREVCLLVLQADDEKRPTSCWTSDSPVVLVNRDIRLVRTGDYEIFAQVGHYESNRVRAKVVDGQ